MVGNKIMIRFHAEYSKLYKMKEHGINAMAKEIQGFTPFILYFNKNQ